MAMDLLQQFFGDQGRQQDYDDFLRRVQNDPNSISDEEAARRYHDLIRNAPPELADEANEAVYSRLPPDMRSRVAQSFQRAHNDPHSPFQGYDYNDPEEAARPGNLSHMARRANEQDPDLLSQIAGSPVGRAAMAAAAAYLASRLLGGQGRSVGGTGGGIGGLGGGLGGDDLGNIIGGLLGGARGGSSRRI